MTACVNNSVHRGVSCGCSCTRGRGMHGCSGRGACMVAPGGMRGCYVGGHAWDTTRYGDTINELGGTHPTGMHSCFIYISG